MGLYEKNYTDAFFATPELCVYLLRFVKQAFEHKIPQNTQHLSN